MQRRHFLRLMTYDSLQRSRPTPCNHHGAALAIRNETYGWAVFMVLAHSSWHTVVMEGGTLRRHELSLLVIVVLPATVACMAICSS